MDEPKPSPRQQAFAALLRAQPRLDRFVHEVTCARKQELRGFLAGQHLRGRGLEIGAQESPTPVRPDRAQVEYVDRLSRAETARRAGIPEERLVDPRHLLDGERLEGIASGSQDFLVAHHVLEHADDPLAVLAEWLRVLRDGGVLFLGLPNFRANEYDFVRSPPRLQRLIDAHAAASGAREENKRRQWREYLERVDELAPGTPAFEASLARHAADDERIHFYVYNEALALALVEHAGRTIAPLSVIDGLSFRWSFEILLVLPKGGATSGRGASRRTALLRAARNRLLLMRAGAPEIEARLRRRLGLVRRG